MKVNNTQNRLPIMAIFSLSIILLVNQVYAETLEPGMDKDVALNQLSSTKNKKENDNKFYIKFQHGQASETDFVNTTLLEFNKSPDSGPLTAISLGKKINDSLFGLPVDIIAYSSIQHFNENHLQADIYGITTSLKAYYDFLLFGNGIQTRVGLAGGLSYVSRIPKAEERDFARKGAESSKLNSHLEYSFDIPLGQFFNLKRHHSSIDEVYIGYTVWHRSTAFGLFGETSGGVNYQGIAIEVIY